jgi:molecular chaperone GrpE (heat shock protein)
MKKKETERLAPANPASASAVPAGEADANDLEDLQADLDRFRDLALRSQADFENYKSALPAKKKRQSGTRTLRCSRG